MIIRITFEFIFLVMLCLLSLHVMLVMFAFVLQQHLILNYKVTSILHDFILTSIWGKCLHESSREILLNKLFWCKRPISSFSNKCNKVREISNFSLMMIILNKNLKNSMIDYKFAKVCLDPGKLCYFYIDIILYTRRKRCVVFLLNFKSFCNLIM